MKQTLHLMLALICINAKAIVEPTITMTTEKSIGETIDFVLCATDDNTQIQIDFGNGNLVSETINSFGGHISGVLIGSNTIKLYGPNIQYFAITDQKLTSIDISRASKLTNLNVSTQPQLTKLDVSNNSALTDLYCNNCNLLELDVTQNVSLKSLYCENNKLTKLDVSKNTELMWLSCASNNLTSLAIDKNLALNVLNCSYNNLKTLDVTNNILITWLFCSNNYLNDLDISKNTTLDWLYCGNNQLAKLDVSKNIVLTDLRCNNNSLTALDVTNNTQLKVIFCNANKLTALDISKNTSIWLFWCENNQFNFNSLPLKQSSWALYSYYPQLPIVIPTVTQINTTIDLSSQLQINNNTTGYTWKTESGTTLTAGTDYTIDGGKTTFKIIPAEKVYCEMTNATFPDLSGTDVLKTTLTTIVSSTATAVEDAKAGTVDIYTRNQTVYLSLPESAEVQVYDITGHQIKAEYYNSGNNSLEVAQKGIYIIKVNMHDQVVSKKIVIR